ncbi:MAG: hypothetical protein Q7T74_04950 [Candidatus Saccharibacteria bacterium]|nr:hypothetical protein [Candidatus Saccharibacteria bacterium]
MLDGTFGSMGISINIDGQIVGISYTNDGRSTHATLWNNGSIFDLNSLIDPSSGWNLWSAQSINNLGWIVGSGFFNGQQHAFLLSDTRYAPNSPMPDLPPRIDPSPSAVPLPSTLALMLFGLVFWALHRAEGKKPAHSTPQA